MGPEGLGEGCASRAQAGTWVWSLETTPHPGIGVPSLRGAHSGHLGAGQMWKQSLQGYQLQLGQGQEPELLHPQAPNPAEGRPSHKAWVNDPPTGPAPFSPGPTLHAPSLFPSQP